MQTLSLYATGTNPKHSFSWQLWHPQGEPGWTCHLVLPPTHPKGQLCFLAGNSGLLPLAGCVPNRAAAADRPREDAAMLACSGMKFLLHLQPAHWWACCWRLLLLIATTETFPVGFSSFSDTSFLLKWLCSVEIPSWVAVVPQLTSAKTRQMHEERN